MPLLPSASLSHPNCKSYKRRDHFILQELDIAIQVTCYTQNVYIHIYVCLSNTMLINYQPIAFE